ncbi:MAG: sugar ABC transporter permease [Thermoanaerobacterium sp.]|nr:sugar ABC transporter permease [Thermoanaerobacterium sp.]
MFKRNRENILWAYTFLSPLLIGMFIFSIIPVTLSFAFSTLDWVGFMPPKFIGLKNYLTALKDQEIYKTIFNTFRIAIIVLPISLFISLLIASALNMGIRFVSVYRVIYYLPVITMPAAIAMVWMYLYNYNYGLLNFLLKSIGLKPINWLGEPSIAWIAIAIMSIWGSLGMQIIILLAALQGVPHELYEAAEIDGANSIVKLFKITIPMISPQVFFLIITGFVALFQLFDPIYIMIGRGHSLLTTKTIVYYFYDTAFRIGDKGYGATIAVIIFFVILMFTAIQMVFQKKWVYYD